MRWVEICDHENACENIQIFQKIFDEGILKSYEMKGLTVL